MTHARHSTPSGPLIPFHDNDVDESVQVMSANPAHIHFLEIQNPNNAAAYLQLFDTTGSVTVGTTVPDLSIYIAPNGGAGSGQTVVEPAYGFQFKNGVKYAMTTTVGGSTGPSNHGVLNSGYRDNKSSINQ